MAVATNNRMMMLKNENIKLRNKMEEIRVVNRAKCVLIELEHLTEAQAHRQIEKQAMDQRMTRKEIAEEILAAYQL